MDGLTSTVQPKSLEIARKWLKEHNRKCRLIKSLRKLERKGKGPAIGEGPTYTFTNTSIGEMQYVECSCGAGELINDYEL